MKEGIEGNLSGSHGSPPVLVRMPLPGSQPGNFLENSDLAMLKARFKVDANTPYGHSVVQSLIFQLERLQGLNAAAHTFARAWANWHEHSDINLDDEAITAGHDIVTALGLEMVEDEETRKQNLVPLSQPLPAREVTP